MESRRSRGAARRSLRVRAILAALFVAFLWSTSWVLIKWGIRDVAPLTFAGLRYSLAFLCLAPILVARRGELRSLSARGWGILIALGLVFYALTQGGQFLALAHLGATTLSLCLSMTPAVAAVVARIAGREAPCLLQGCGIALAAGGAAAYFGTRGASGGSALGFLFAGLTLGANVAASFLGRRVNRDRIASPVVVTAVSMAIGAAVLLALGVSIEGAPHIPLRTWGLIGWLAVVNTAFAFTLWNRTLQTLSAVESTVLNNTMLVQVALLAWLFLGESLAPVAILGLALTAVGTLLVQLRAAT